MTVATEASRDNLAVAGVGLFFHASQILFHFLGSACHITLGVKSCFGTSVILENASVWAWNTAIFHGHFTSGTVWMVLF